MQKSGGGNKRPEKQQQQQKKGGDNKSQQQKSQKNKAPRQNSTDPGDVDKREQKLQAILLADSFTRSFRPITSERPKVLLPLVNIPMLEYTIEFLAQNGVEEVK